MKGGYRGKRRCYLKSMLKLHLTLLLSPTTDSRHTAPMTHRQLPRNLCLDGSLVIVQK
jgi:hypothetical protein